jgi:hypothetical protein
MLADRGGKFTPFNDLNSLKIVLQCAKLVYDEQKQPDNSISQL